MGIYKEVEDKQLGRIYCKVTEAGEPICWAKKQVVCIYNEPKEIEILLDLYCFNKNFQSRNLMDAESNIEKILEWYERFKESKVSIQNALWRSYKSFLKKGTIGMIKINNKEELERYITTEYVMIYTYGYAIIFSVPWSNERLAVKQEEWNNYGKAYTTSESTLDKVQLDFTYD